MEAHKKVVYLPVDGDPLCTVVLTPGSGGKYPSVLVRSPYEREHESLADGELADRVAENYKNWLDAGYAVFFQHCRGTGKSGGDCVPFVHEREEGLALQRFAREQDFYNGEIYLLGGSYTASVHYATAPFAPDIKGASFESMTDERYDFFYRSGSFNMGLIGAWHASLYKCKSGVKNNYSNGEYLKRPLTEFTRRVFGETVADYDGALRHPDRRDPFWNTREGGSDCRGALRGARIPIFLSVGTVDTFAHGVLKMWEELDEETRAMSALVVHPYHHGGTSEDQPVRFEGGELSEFIDGFDLSWIEHARRGTPPPVPLGRITYYEQFGAGWLTDGGFDSPSDSLVFTFGGGKREFVYDPERPTEYVGGLTHAFRGTSYMDPPGREGTVTFFTEPFDEDVRIRGKMRLKLAVSSDCPDTAFYVRVGIAKKEGDFSIRDDIDLISNHVPDYRPGDPVKIEFELDPYAGVVKKGERLRVDVASSAYPIFVPHTNTRGLFSEQTETRIARNTVDAGGCSLTVGRI
ncbi:MAG: CocE/NonD family hydrolase [Clostridia bacterium]|nr:CocE/NonD family hydrolase [Clostridia bacterium]